MMERPTLVKHLRIINALVLLGFLCVNASAQFGRGFFPSFSDDDPNGLLTGLQGYWKFDEASGNALDSSGNARHLTENSTLASVDGKILTSRAHDSAAAGDYFSVANAAWNSFGSGNFTIAFWFKVSDPGGGVNDQVLIAKSDLNDATSWSVAIDNGIFYANGYALTFYRNSSDGTLVNFTEMLNVELPEAIVATDWYACVVTRVGNVFTMYVAREDAGTISAGDTATEAITLYDNSTVPLTVGCYLSSGTPETTQDTEGQIDELVIANVGWSACQVSKYFAAGLGLAFSDYDVHACSP